MDKKDLFLYDKEANKASKELDKYDLSGVLVQCKRYTLARIQDFILASYPQLEVHLDCLGNEEFMKYFEERYGAKFYPVETWFMSI